MNPHLRQPAGGGRLVRLLRAWAFLLVVALPAVGLVTVYLVRHAEKADPWVQDKDLDAFWPLSPAGTVRAEALAGRLEKTGITAIYTSRTTRTLATAMPLVARLRVPVTADEASIHAADMPGFLARLREKHAGDAAVLIVGHSNTIPRLLVLLGAGPECYARLGIIVDGDSKDGLLIEGYEGLWKVDLRRKGCEAVTRE
ncbi:MAG TPA: phosphoglycerate mutase family protein [Thermoanaerobaculia bacterium]|jgi:broad specificity phosphatase PhoE|nr:phosphoglycerate mutase family protein [Thermoanaerobaculia bacterium]